MFRQRLKTNVGSHILLVFLLCCGADVGKAAEEIAPDRSISVVKSTPQAPEWKVHWDTARLFVRENKLHEAARSYAEVYRIKPNIEEASWEYCKVLLRIKDFDGVARIIAHLLEGNATHPEYQLMAGKVALHKKDYAKAIQHFGLVLENAPTGEHSLAAIAGFAESLKSRGRKEESFTLFEQLVARSDDMPGIIRKMAFDAVTLGKKSKARWFFGKLLEQKNVDKEVIFQAVEIFDDPGFEKMQELVIKRYLKRFPEYLPFRLKLIEILEKEQDFSGVFENLSYLLENNQSGAYDELLLKSARIAIENIDRPDKALIYLNEYNQKYPGNTAIETQIENVQNNLAEDLLAIVENDGALLLWQDLAGLEPSRLAIFKKMAALLEERSKNTELINVLEIIHSNSLDNIERDGVALKLARMFYEIKTFESSLAYLKKINIEQRNKEYLQFRGQIEVILGLEIEGMKSFRKALKLDPADNTLRLKCLQLAGSLGLVAEQVAFFDYWMKGSGPGGSVQSVISHIRLLGYNYTQSEIEKVVNWAERNFIDRKEDTVLIGIEEARALRRVGKKRRASQSLRMLLNKKIWVDKILFELAEAAIADNNLTIAGKWIEILEKNRFEGTAASSPATYRGRLFLTRAKMHRLAEAYDDTLKDLEAARREIDKLMDGEPEKVDLRHSVDIENALVLSSSGNTKAALEFIQRLEPDHLYGPEKIVVCRIVSERAKGIFKKEKFEKFLYVNGQPVVSRILALAEKELQYGRKDDAEHHLGIVLKRVKNSVLGIILESQTKLKRGEIATSFETLEGLDGLLTKEPYICERRSYLKTLQGQYNAAVEQLGNCYTGSSDPKDLARYLISKNEEGAALRLARLLWSDRKHKRSLRLYKKILSPSIRAILTQQFSEKKINPMDFDREESFWSSMMQLLQSEPELVEQIMEPEFLMDNLGNDTAKLVAANYEKYSWQNLIRSEYQAREAVYDRNYSFAEQRYKKLLAQEKTTEAMADLANIYGRIGEYRKEAQLYEDIKTSGTATPELTDSIKQSSLRIKPQNIIDSSFAKKDGRDGYVDLEQARIGTSFWFIHDFNKDFKFSYLNSSYDSVDGSEKTGSNMINVLTNWELTQNYELTAGAGVEKLNDESDNNFLYEIRLDAQLDDNVKGFAEIDDRPVTDTVLSIKEHIMARSISTGLEFDTPFGLEFGGDLLYKTYSDNNAQNRFHGFTSYTIFGESVRLDFRYDYNFLRNDITNPESDEQEVADDADSILSYWSPEKFTSHTLGIYFQHDFLGYEEGKIRKMSYYSLDGSIGIEDNETLVYSTKFDIFLEMSPHFLLKGNFSLSTSKDYEETGLSASLHYRW